MTAGLAAIHEAGIIHRDVTTQNVLRLADGRLVVSDFGLAMDADETTASVQGGTVAYMAPELTAGARATSATDIWALGIVIHEIVFGDRPTWRRNVVSRRIESPRSRLTGVEAAVLDICRGCTALDPRTRPKDALVVLHQLGRAVRRGPRLPHPTIRSLVVGGGALLVLGLGIGQLPHRARDLARRSAPAAKSIEPTGIPTDATDLSTVLTTVSDRIHCLVILPGGTAARFVWGVPMRADDMDLQTGQRHPASLMPEAYALGCPDLSPDGRALVFQGHDKTGRPLIF